MNYSTAVFLNDNVVAVKAIYESIDKNNPEKQYVFKTLDHAIKVDDLVLVPTDTRFGFAVCKITEINVAVDIDGPTQIKWIAGVYDPTEYKATLEMEKTMVLKLQDIEKNKKRRELKAAMLADSEEAKTLLALPMLSAAAT